jgi:hypothetical protein
LCSLDEVKTRCASQWRHKWLGSGPASLPATQEEPTHTNRDDSSVREEDARLQRRGSCPIGGIHSFASQVRGIERIRHHEQGERTQGSGDQVGPGGRRRGGASSPTCHDSSGLCRLLRLLQEPARLHYPARPVPKRSVLRLATAAIGHDALASRLRLAASPATVASRSCRCRSPSPGAASPSRCRSSRQRRCR